MGGQTKRVARLGDRFHVKFQTSSLPYNYAIGLLAKINQGTTQKLRVPIWQSNLKTAGSNAQVATGAGQTLYLKNMTPGYQIRAGQYFTIYQVVGLETRHYLHMATSTVTADGSGNATISILPTLRRTAIPNAHVEFENPTVEGFLASEAFSYTLKRGPATTAFSFTIVESE